MKIAFLYFDHIHHIYHSVSIAIALSRLLGSEHEVTLLTSTEENANLLEKVCANNSGHYCKLVLLPPTWYHRLFSQHMRQFPRKSRILKKYRGLLAKYDAIVGTELSTPKLQRYLGDKTPKLILTNHGAGDRRYGLQEDLKKYDFILISGEKIKNRLQMGGVFKHCQHAVTGYAKFDNTTSTYTQLETLFPDTAERKTVLYNPHFASHQHSWTKLGDAIMDYFCRSDKYNLIFAPHIMLFDPRYGHKILDRWKNHSHIHIDTGSLASADMSYTNLADIYIGDVSSQIYEFIIKPRYCILLNAYKVDWKNEEGYLHWTAGDVVDNSATFVDTLNELLANAEQRQSHYLEQQKQLIRNTFSVDQSRSASERSAQAIVDFLRITPSPKDQKANS